MMTFTQLLKRILGFPQYDDDIVPKSDFYAPSIDLPAPIEPPHRDGRVVTAAKHQDYSPDVRRTGGRVVKVMPRELKQIKKAQETLTDEDSTPVTAGLSGN
jgi:hypothetical protein